ncbi:hypothetical protein Hanom_Chr04g00364831 [Helianthus anomalus]
MVGQGLRTCRLGCCGLPFGQWLPRTEYPAILMLDVSKKEMPPTTTQTTPRGLEKWKTIKYSQEREWG